MGGHNGFAGETVVTTRQGPSPIRNLVGRRQELLTSDGRWVNALVNLIGKAEVNELVLSRSGVLKTVRATAGQQWPLRNLRGCIAEARTDALLPGYRLRFTFPKRPTDLEVERISAARGFVFGDGSRASIHRSVANFCGDKDRELLRLFAGLGRPPRYYEKVTRISGLPRDWKQAYISLASDPSSIYGWLSGYFAADGDVDRTGRPTLTSASRENLEFVRLACQEVGIGTFGIRTRMRTGYGKEPSAMHLVGIMRSDLAPDFFLITSHRVRYEAGRNAAERRGWNVVSVAAKGERTDIYSVDLTSVGSFALSDNVLTSC